MEGSQGAPFRASAVSLQSNAFCSCCWKFVIFFFASFHVVLGVSGSVVSGSRTIHDYPPDKVFTNHTDETIKRLSKVFGIERIPGAQRVYHSAPDYMRELYESTAYNDGISRSQAPYDADVVRGLTDKAARHSMYFHFNVSHVTHTEDVLGAELRLYRLRPRPVGRREGGPRVGGDPRVGGNPGPDRRGGRGGRGARQAGPGPDQTRAPPRRNSHVLQLRLYALTAPPDAGLGGGGRLVAERRLSAHQHGWQVFRVGDTVRAWVNASADNYGFLLTAVWSEGGAPVGDFRFAQRHEHHDSKQPVLVVYTRELLQDLLEDEEFLGQQRMAVVRRKYVKHLNEGYRAQHGAHPRRRTPRHYMTSQTHDRLMRDAQSERAPRRSSRRTKRSKRSGELNYKYGRNRRKKSCSRRELYVDFEKIGWSGWIISPKGYNAYHCRGDCPFPLGQNQHPTNHATVQSIVNAMRIVTEVGTPCCVPNKLFPISLLYFDDDENVILKQYDQMVAASCGCH